MNTVIGRGITFASILMALSCFWQSVYAQGAVSEEQRTAFVNRLSSYGQCNKSCAIEVFKLIGDEGTTSALAVAGLVKGGQSKALKGKGGAVAAYAVFNQILTSGGKIVDTYGVCARTCDELYSDVVELGRAGLIGPITKGKPIPEAWLEDPQIKGLWDKHIKPLKPSDLPPAFHNDARWKEIMATA